MSQLYSEAAAVLAPSLRGSSGSNRNTASLKTRTYSDKVTNKKLTHLLVSETLKHREAIDCILAKCNVELLSLSKNQALVYIYLFELLFGRTKRMLGGGSLKKQILLLQGQLEAAKVVVMKTFPELAQREKVPMPRYCRVNTIKSTVKQVLEEFPHAVLDKHIPLLLHLPANTDLHDHPLVTSGQLILQDKSSCFPVAALEMEMEKRKLFAYDSIDCCAAPGNKTTQLCAAIHQRNPKSQVFAFDKSVPRHALLQQRMNQAGGKAVCLRDDFLEQSAQDERFQRVRTILLDPSCSGSGSYSVERTSEAKMKEDDERVTRLAHFQLEILSHALSFPQVELVSYSTCSILFPENELVCQQALDKFGSEWELVEALPQWSRRGVVKPMGLDEANTKLVVRADFTQGDATGGFFLALFARKQNSGTVATTTELVPSTLNRRKRYVVVRNLVTKRIVRRHEV
ncbi:hypothetical protein BASA81_009145 [Batrachochytrium salamandrivorans]|nr:hypothetical protein BASA81_009145 [Batrachochytrium salamandrivorans]